MRNLVTILNNLINFLIAIYKINLSTIQDMYLRKAWIYILIFMKNLYYETLGSGLNPCGV